MECDLKRSVDLWWLFDPVLHSSLDDLVIFCPTRSIAQMSCFENWCCIARFWRRLISWLSSIFATVLSLSLQLLSRLFRLLQDSQSNSHHKIDNLKSAHDWKSRKKSQSASDHRDLGHYVGFCVFRDPIHCWSVEEDVHYVQFELWFDAWKIYSWRSVNTG